MRDSHEQMPASSRRRALKIGAATVAGAVVWAEPTIKGLATRPAYAQACSTNPASITTVYQAESGIRSGPSIDTNHAGYTGSGFINYNGSGSVEYQNVEGGCGGLATVRIRYALASGSRTGSITVNGMTQSITFTATGAWANWADLDVFLMLEPGTANTIILSSTGADLGNVDRITVITAGV